MTTFKYNSIVKATEKAVLVNAAISFNDNISTREIWICKSQIKNTTEDNMMTISDWMMRQIAEKNTFNGYRMSFAFSENC